MKLAFSTIDDRDENSFVIDIPDNPRIEPEIVIGRAANCDIQIPQQSVSRRHCGIRVDTTNKSLHVWDFGSQNGTFVNGRFVDEECEIADGDTLKIGFLALTVHFAGATVWERIAARARVVQIGKPRKMHIADG